MFPSEYKSGGDIKNGGFTPSLAPDLHIKEESKQSIPGPQSSIYNFLKQRGEESKTK